VAEVLNTYWLLRIGGRFVETINPATGVIQLTRSDTLDNVYRYYTLDDAEAAANLVFRWAEREPPEWIYNKTIGIVEAKFTEVSVLPPCITPRPPPVPKRPGERPWTEDAQAVLDVWTAYCERVTGHPNCYERIDRKTRQPVLFLWEPCYERRPDGGVYGVVNRVTKRLEGTFWGDRSNNFNISGDGEIRLAPMMLKRAWREHLRKLSKRKS
jgi:hypothetical protein